MQRIWWLRGHDWLGGFVRLLISHSNLKVRETECYMCNKSRSGTEERKKNNKGVTRTSVSEMNKDIHSTQALYIWWHMCC